MILGVFVFSDIKDRINTTPTATPTPVVTPLADDLFILEAPLPGAEIHSPLQVRGQARGTWFFEGSFPLILTDWDGLIIAEGYATAQGEWMTTDWVPFEGELVFEKPTYGTRGTLILQKDNPSDLPEFDDAREITIFFE